MKIHKQGGNVIYEGKVNIKLETFNTIESLNRRYPGFNKFVTLTENLSASDKRRKLTTVELSQDEIKQCADKIGLKLMPQWLVTVCEVSGKVKVKFKGLVK